MPVYPYECEPCHRTWDVVKSVSSIDNPEACPACSKPGVRRIARVNFNGASDWNTQSWNPGLGCYTRNNRHARQIAKARGLEEVGNEKPDVIHKHFDQQREAAREQRWNDALKDKVYE